MSDTEPIPANVMVDGTELRRRRQLRGDTVTTFAERAGLSLGYISQIERGTRPTVSPPAFMQIVRALGLPDDRAHEIVKAA